MSSPRTEAGKALLATLNQEWVNRDPPYHADKSIIEVENEAAAGYGAQEMEDAVGVLAVADVRNQRHIEALGAQVAALRHALKGLNTRVREKGDVAISDFDDFSVGEVLNDTASAAAGYGPVEPWREAATKSDEMHRGCDCYGHRTARALLSQPDKQEGAS